MLLANSAHMVDAQHGDIQVCFDGHANVYQSSSQQLPLIKTFDIRSERTIAEQKLVQHQAGAPRLELQRPDVREQYGVDRRLMASDIRRDVRYGGHHEKYVCSEEVASLFDGG